MEVINDKIVVVVNISGTVCNVPPDPGSGEFPESIGNVTVEDDPSLPEVFRVARAPGIRTVNRIGIGVFVH